MAVTLQATSHPGTPENSFVYAGSVSSASRGVGDPPGVLGREWKSGIVIHFPHPSHTALTRQRYIWSLTSCAHLAFYGTGHMSPPHKHHLASSPRPLYPSELSGKNQF